MCHVVSDSDSEPATWVSHLDEYLKDHKSDPLMSQYGRDTGQQLLNLTKKFAARNDKPQEESSLKDADRIEAMQGTVAALNLEALTREEAALIEAELSKVRRAVKLARTRSDVQDQIGKRDKETKPGR